MSISKKQFIDNLAQSSGLSKSNCARLVDHIAAQLIENLLEHGQCTLPNIGKFVVKDKAARKGRNPRTGEVIQIPATRSLSFKATKHVKSSLNR